jgi:uncharacterized protein YigA (DUF484 family)
MPNLVGDELMDNTNEIRRQNLEISAKFSKIGMQLPKAKNIAKLFEMLFEEIEKEFNIPFVWITLIDSENAAPIISAIKSSAQLKNRLKVLHADVFNRILPNGLAPVLANSNLQPYYKLLPPSNKYFIKSLAIVPFCAHKEIVGSWNNGDVESDHYRPGMETSLLEKLAEAVSRRLTELMSAGK